MAKLLPLGHTEDTTLEQSGRVLVRNRHFLRHRSPASCGPPTLTQQLLPASQPATYSPLQDTVTQPSQPPRHSQRAHRVPARLIEDPNWP